MDRRREGGRHRGRSGGSGDGTSRRRLLDRLGEDVLRKVAILRLEGETTEAIAEQLGCARRTVARNLALIRRILAMDST